ncbi:MAG: hypothetical protein DWQ05_21345 [Calditrichaeota bacterium]|nr:MAG: hypothetical protein DWQ05_21345 [Calditrichota bacterium]
MQIRVGYFICLFLVVHLCSPGAFAQKQRTKIEAQIAQAYDHIEKKDYKAARAAFKKSLKIYNKSTEALEGFGKLEMRLENWETAEDKFNQILKLEPENLTAHYYRAICLREDGIGKARFIQMAPGLNRLLEWKKAEKEFQWIIQQDSLFKDVIYQYSILESHREKFKEAIDLAHRQLQIHPQQVSTSLGIFRHYHQLIRNKNNDETERWLEKNNQREHARYFLAEKWRRSGQFEEAQNALLKLLQPNLKMSPIPIYFSLALINKELNKSFEAQQFYWRGIQNIKSKIDAHCHFERVKYIFTEDELNRYSALSEPEEFISLFEKIWLLRDPTPAAQLNVRLLEHLRRYAKAEKDFEYLGVRNHSNNPDKLNQLNFPAPYKLNKEFNDKGFVFIRHGEPDDRVITIAESSTPNDSWRYYAHGAMPELTFHFMVDKTALPDNWRLTPILTDEAMLRDRMDWDTDYYRMLNAPKVEQLSIESELIHESKISVNEAFTTDRHTWTEQIKPLALDYSISTFRDNDNKTRVEIFYGLPLQQVQKHAGGREIIFLNQGLSLHNSAWDAVKKDQLYSELLIPKNPVDPRILIINAFRFSIEPDDFHIALHAKPQQTPLLGGFKFDYKVADYSSAALMISDIHLAYNIQPAKDSKFTRKDLDILVNPTGRFSQLKPFHTYFEVYNLKKDSAGKTRFEVTHKLKLMKSKKSAIAKFFSLFGVGKKSSISLTNMREGTTTEAIEHLALAAQSVDPGQYKLTIRIQDMNSGESTSKDRNLVLY